jgi:hypothetical protein
MAIITGWLVFEFGFIYFMYPETAGRTLEELAFCKSIPEPVILSLVLIGCNSVRRQGIRRPGHCRC